MGSCRTHFLLTDPFLSSFLNLFLTAVCDRPGTRPHSFRLCSPYLLYSSDLTLNTLVSTRTLALLAHLDSYSGIPSWCYYPKPDGEGPLQLSRSPGPQSLCTDPQHRHTHHLWSPWVEIRNGISVISHVHSRPNFCHVYSAQCLAVFPFPGSSL